MKTKTTFLAILAFAFLALTAKAQYHEDDKAALRNFLKRPSAEAGKMNGEQVGLSAATINMNGWLMNDTWLTALQGVTWNTESPKRIIKINWTDKKLADTLNLGRCTSLTELRCAENKITNLDVTKNTALTHLIYYLNQLTNLDVTKNTALIYLDGCNNSLTGLDVTKNTALITLGCSDNQLTNLDVSKNTALIVLVCYNNQLTNLDVTKNTALTLLSCSQNQLTNLDVSKNIALRELHCYANQLTNLDVSKNTALTSLYCNNNQLTNLDITKNTALTKLNCSDNKLTNLDVSKNTALENLECYYNQLKFSTLPQGSYGYDYSPQNTIKGGNIKIGSEIDLSSEYTIAGNTTTYQWFDGATETPAAEYTAANGKFTFSNPSFLNKTLTCQMTNATFPLLTLVYEATLTNETGIAETGNGEIQLAIYPNPTKGEVKIVTPNPLKGANELGKSPLGDLGVQLFDLTGKQVFETRKTEFNIGHLPNGLYLLKAVTDKGIVNRKIIKN